MFNRMCYYAVKSGRIHYVHTEPHQSLTVGLEGRLQGDRVINSKKKVKDDIGDPCGFTGKWVVSACLALAQ